MMDPEIPNLSEDTQPITSPTRPTIPRRSQPPPRRIWTMGALALFSAVSLLATVALLLSGTWQQATAALQTVTLVRDGQSVSLQTGADTIGTLLSEQQITLSGDEVLLAELDTPLTEGLIVSIMRLRTVNLIVDGESQNLRTPYTNPLDIITSIEFPLELTDRIWLDGSPAALADLALWPVPVTEIVVNHAQLVTIMDGDSEISIQTHAETVGDALYDAGVTIFFTDSVVPDVGAPLPADGQIHIDRARPVQIVVDGITIETRVRGATVAAALVEASVPLLGLDYTIPPEDTSLEAGMIINVLRVTEVIESYEETIPYETIYQADAALELDVRAVLQGGQFGRRRYDERVRYENGIEVGREPIGSEIVQEAVSELIAYGTSVVIRTVSTPDGPREYWRRLRMYATSYHPEALGGDDRTSIGETLRHGIIASNPTVIPYRTNLFVPGYGLGMMADTGGPRSTPYWVDLGYSDEDYVSWSRYVDVYLLTPVPGNINYLLPEWQPLRGRPDN